MEALQRPKEIWDTPDVAKVAGGLAFLGTEVTLLAANVLPKSGLAGWAEGLAAIVAGLGVAKVCDRVDSTIFRKKS